LPLILKCRLSFVQIINTASKLWRKDMDFLYELLKKQEEKLKTYGFLDKM